MSRTRIVEAMIPVESGADGVPAEFRLLKAGINTYNDGDQILFDGDAAESVMRRYRARGIDLMADYEHQSLVQPPVGPAPASAKKWVPEVRGGDLLATQVAWTEKAKSMLAAGEYRYFSIACRVDAKTNRCVELINFALTNLPAANGIAALVAASRNFTDEENKMSKTLIVALGMNADADEAAAVAHAARLAELERDVLTLTKAKSLTEAAGTLRAYAQSHEQVVALTAKVAQLETAQRSAEFDALVLSGQDPKAPKLTPAMASSDWIKSLRAREDGVAQLKSFLASAPNLVATPGAIVEAPPVAGEPEVTAIDKQIAARLVGPDPVAQKKHLDELKAYRAQLKERN